MKNNELNTSNAVSRLGGSPGLSTLYISTTASSGLKFLSTLSVSRINEPILIPSISSTGNFEILSSLIFLITSESKNYDFVYFSTKRSKVGILSDCFYIILLNYLNKKITIHVHGSEFLDNFKALLDIIGIILESFGIVWGQFWDHVCLLYTSPSPRD